MKKLIWTVTALVMMTLCGSLGFQQTAQAEEVQFELLGKLGGSSDNLDKISLGDPIFDVSGGLEIAAMFRFDMGIGVGLNFNWTMIRHRLEQTKLTYAMEARNRKATVQHPSIGLVLRYEMLNLLDLGLWMNYGFGSIKNSYDDLNPTVMSAYGLTDAHFKWDLQTFELGIMCAFMYKITNINLDVIVGLQGFVDFSRMLADDDSLRDARDITGRHLDENSLYTVGFNIVFGARYDLIFGEKKNKIKN